MRAFTNSRQQTGRRTTACGYCRTTGHSIKECPYIKHDHDEWRAFRVPHTSPVLQTGAGRWFMNDYSYWIKQIDKYYPKWERWQQPRDNEDRAVSTSPRRCGFCRAEGHTRRDCPEMARIYKDLLQANRNYRQALYDTFVTRLGFGVGAVLKVEEDNGSYGNPQVQERLVTVESFDMDTANLFMTSSSYQVDREYCGDISIRFLSDECRSGYYSSHSSMNLKEFQDSQGRKLATKSQSFYRQSTYASTVAPAKQPLDPEWVDRDADAFEWLLKKRTLEWLEDRSMIDIIDRWK